MASASLADGNSSRRRKIPRRQSGERHDMTGGIAVPELELME